MIDWKSQTVDEVLGDRFYSVERGVSVYAPCSTPHTNFFSPINQNAAPMMQLMLNLTFTVLLLPAVSAINPMREYKMRPENFQLNYRELKIETEDGYQLNTWIMEPETGSENPVTVIVAGSDAGNMGFNLPYAFYLLRSGYRVVTFDYRGFGDSTEFKFDPKNVYHSEYITDFVSVLNWCREELKPEKIGVLAFSMGTLVTAAGYSASPYDFYIGEGFVLSPEENRARIKKLRGKWLNLPDTATEDTQKINDLDIPILLFAGIADEITTVADSHRFCDTRRNAKTIEFAGEHLRGAATLGMEKYIEAINKFIGG